jgi:hypothetical protein
MRSGGLCGGGWGLQCVTAGTSSMGVWDPMHGGVNGLHGGGCGM